MKKIFAASATVVAVSFASLGAVAQERVGDAAFVDSVAAKRIVRFVDCCDAETIRNAPFGDQTASPTFPSVIRVAGISTYVCLGVCTHSNFGAATPKLVKPPNSAAPAISGRALPANL